MDWDQIVKHLSVSSNEGVAYRLIDGNHSTYWQSSGPQGKVVVEKIGSLTYEESYPLSPPPLPSPPLPSPPLPSPPLPSSPLPFSSALDSPGATAQHLSRAVSSTGRACRQQLHALTGSGAGREYRRRPPRAQAVQHPGHYSGVHPPQWCDRGKLSVRGSGHKSA